MACAEGPLQRSTGGFLPYLACITFMMLAARAKCYSTSVWRLARPGTLARLRGGSGSSCAAAGNNVSNSAVATETVLSPEGTTLSADRMHVTLAQEELGPSGRCIIVGDVHGCFDELKVRERL